MGIFDVKKDVFTNLKDYVITNSQYSPKVLQRAIDGTLPLVVFEEARNEQDSVSTDYSYSTRLLNYNINVYAKDISNISSVEICNELSQLIIEVMEGYYHMRGGIVALLPRYDNNSTSYQINLRFTTRVIPSQNKIY